MEVSMSENHPIQLQFVLYGSTFEIPCYGETPFMKVAPLTDAIPYPNRSYYLWCLDLKSGLIYEVHYLTEVLPLNNKF